VARPIRHKKDPVEVARPTRHKKWSQSLGLEAASLRMVLVASQKSIKSNRSNESQTECGRENPRLLTAESPEAEKRAARQRSEPSVH
jgi:hypothetical protein